MCCKYFGPKIWLSFLSFGFGIVTLCHAFITNYEGLLAARFFLGALEAGIMPGISFTLSQFYRRHELATRVGFYAAVSPLAGAFGGLLATGLSKIPQFGMVHTWRSIFFFEGWLSIILGVVAFFLLPNHPSTAKCLSPAERRFAAWRIAEESLSHVEERTSMKHFISAMRSPHVHLNGIACACSMLTMASMGLFMPTILNAMGYSAIHAQLMSVPPFAWATIVCLAIAILSDKMKTRGVFLLGIVPVSAIGFILLIAVKNQPAVRYFATFLALTGAFTASPMIVAWTVDNTAGPNVRAISAAYVVTLANLGGIIATWTYLLPDAPWYIPGHAINLGAAVICCIMLASATIYLRWENRARREGKRDWKLEGLTQVERNALGHKNPEYVYTP
jgi:MFS family permease